MSYWGTPAGAALDAPLALMFPAAAVAAPLPQPGPLPDAFGSCHTQRDWDYEVGHWAKYDDDAAHVDYVLDNGAANAWVVQHSDGYYYVRVRN